MLLVKMTVCWEQYQSVRRYPNTGRSTARKACSYIEQKLKGRRDGGSVSVRSARTAPISYPNAVDLHKGNSFVRQLHVGDVCIGYQ